MVIYHYPKYKLTLNKSKYFRVKCFLYHSPEYSLPSLRCFSKHKNRYCKETEEQIPQDTNVKPIVFCCKLLHLVPKKNLKVIHRDYDIGFVSRVLLQLPYLPLHPSWICSLIFKELLGCWKWCSTAIFSNLPWLQTKQWMWFQSSCILAPRWKSGPS